MALAKAAEGLSWQLDAADATSCSAAEGEDELDLRDALTRPAQHVAVGAVGPKRQNHAGV